MRILTWAVLALLPLSLAACGGSARHASTPKSRPATQVRLSTTGSVVSFREGVIDNTGWHGARDARLMPNGQLAVLTYGGGCADHPAAVTGSGHHVTINYVPPKIPPDAVCPAYLAPFTALVRLPAAVDANLPLQVTVDFSGATSYTVSAR